MKSGILAKEKNTKDATLNGDDPGQGKVPGVRERLREQAGRRDGEGG